MVEKSIFGLEEKNIPKMPIINWILAILHDKDQKRSIDALSIMYETFIFVKEVLPSLETEFEFKLSGYGPYSEKVAKVLRQFLSANILEIEKNRQSIFKGNRYHLTKSGDKKAEQIFLQFPETMKNKMKFMNSITSLMGLTGMLQYIYSIYPQYVYLHEGGKEIV